MVVMGDLSAEPSMEEILSSIKRIIAEEGEAPVRGRRMGRAAPSASLSAAVDEVLELSDPMPATPAAAELTRRAEARAQWQGEPVAPATEVAPEPPARPVPEPTLQPAPQPSPSPRVEPVAMPSAAPVSAEPEPQPIASAHTVDASRGALDSLSRILVKPEAGSDGTLEGMVRDMLRPMLREWLDRNLPGLVEDMVAREIARISPARD